MPASKWLELLVRYFVRFAKFHLPPGFCLAMKLYCIRSISVPNFKV